MKHYIVISPVIDDIGFYGYECYEPPESYVCYTSVEANSPREARFVAMHSKDMQGWVNVCRDNNQNPFTGLEVSEGICLHGFCWCGCSDGECEDCVNEVADEE